MNGAPERKSWWQLEWRSVWTEQTQRRPVRTKYGALVWNWIMTCKQGSATPFAAPVLRLLNLYWAAMLIHVRESSWTTCCNFKAAFWCGWQLCEACRGWNDLSFTCRILALMLLVDFNIHGVVSMLRGMEEQLSLVRWWTYGLGPKASLKCNWTDTNMRHHLWVMKDVSIILENRCWLSS